MMAQCQLCETIPGALRTAAGVPSPWRPLGEGVMKRRSDVGGRLPEGGCSAGERGTLAGCPSLWARTTGDVHCLHEKHLKGGNTDGGMQEKCIL